eukprot:jgi/Chrzof1/14037/Cz08g22050.t1
MVLLPAFLYPSIELPDNYLHYTANETMLRHIVMECIKRQSTTVFINTRGKLAVQDMTAAYENCPPLDIMLGASERGIGMCTDVALYVLHAGARLIPRVPVGVYNGFCRQQTARLFLETVYEEWLQNTTGIRTVMLPNFENFYEGGIDQHRQMKEIICKHRTCEALMKQYVLDKSLPAKVTYMGHTSMDPSVGHESAARSVSQLLHVKGKSPHKYTTELLQCYANRPNYPPLTVVGQATVPELSWVSSDQVSFVPKPNERTWDGNLGGAQAGRELAEFEDVRRLQNSHGIHVCVSEREGFGHYINEARAVGALVVTTNHPPMNELITEETGVLVQPYRTRSYDFQALKHYGAINAIVSWLEVCPVLDDVVAMPASSIAHKGKLARRAYLKDKADFESRINVWKDELYREWAREVSASGQSPPLPITGPALPVWAQQQQQQQSVAMFGGRRGGVSTWSLNWT